MEIKFAKEHSEDGTKILHVFNGPNSETDWNKFLYERIGLTLASPGGRSCIRSKEIEKWQGPVIYHSD